LLLGACSPQVQTENAPSETAGISSERLEHLHSGLNAYVDSGDLPGYVALVTRAGQVVFHEAYGQRDIEADLPMTEETIFRIASQTKALVSVAVMILQEEGQLLLGDPVSKYLPEFGETTVAVEGPDGEIEVVAAERPINIRDLLTHTAGIGYGGGLAEKFWAEAGIQGWYFADRDEPIRATVGRMASLPFLAQPGEEFVYGYSTDILGALVEEVSGDPLDEFLQERLFDPLGMTDSHFYLPPSKRDRLATVYSRGENGLERTPETGGMINQGAYVEGPRKSFSGGAGMLSTAKDYERFLQMMLNGGILDGVRILSPKTVELMTVSHFDTGWDGEDMGLGFAVVEDLGARGIPGSTGEYGWGGAYHTSYWVDPVEDLVVVYMTQLIPTAGLDDHGKLRALVYQAIVDSPSDPR
jgi:CubicO group peptidase (beta-lactamase class C family)